MSRKRKPVLQLDAGTSKLHKYGYSKEFHSSDKKAKSSLPNLVGSYSDSDSDNSTDEQEEQQANDAANKMGPNLAHTSTHQLEKLGNGDAGKPDQDIDDELKNFLSEIEAIPMPNEVSGANSQDSGISEQKPAIQAPSRQAEENVTPDTSDKLSGDSSTQDVEAHPTKRNPQYSMFVKGASEFVQSPSSIETDVSSAKDKETGEVLDEQIPEEPTTCWQIVQDEGSQYYYYWNTLTNEVTWEIPSEYTQFLLLHREFTEKLARLPPNLLKKYEERKAKAAEALTMAATKKISGATNGADSKQTMSGPAGHASTKTPSNSTISSQKKHKKDKKKRRHKRKHSDSDSNSSDAEDNDTSKTPMYGPQLPQTKHLQSSSSKQEKTTTDSQLLSIVPYLSDEDEPDETEDSIKKPDPVQEKVKIASELQSDSVGIESSLNKVSEPTEASIDKGVTKLENSTEKDIETIHSMLETSGLVQIKDSEHSQSNVAENAEQALTSSKEVIDMFAEVTYVANHNKSSKSDNDIVQKDMQVSALSHSSLKDDSLSLTELSTGLTKSLTTANGSEGSKLKGNNNSSSLLSIVGYATDEEEKKESRVEEETKGALSPSLKQPLSPTDLKQRKKEKKKLKHKDDKKDKGKEIKDVSAINILGNKLGKDIKAKVEETLDKISDIVIQTVSQTVLPAATAQLSPSPSEPGKSAASEERSVLQGTSENNPELEQKQKDIIEDKDDEDIDFEDLDDLDRALEVALEKKKVELAKYEEQERKEQISADIPKLEVQSVTELSCDKVEPTSEHEEKLKTEVKDAADLALSKLEFLDIATDNLSRLQILFIELQTRLHDWTAGGLSTVYFQEQLGIAQGLLEQYEQSAVPQGWACQWDRNNHRYYYRNLSTNQIQWDYPEEDPAKAIEDKVDVGIVQDKKSVGSSGKSSKETAEKKSSFIIKEKSRDKDGGGGGSGEDKDSSRKKGGSRSRHGKREERDKDRGGKHDKRRDGNSSSHRYRRKRRRRRDHSSSSDSSDDGGGDSNSITAAKSSSVTSSRKHHRHHHKASKKKKKRRSQQRSRTPSVEIVVASDDREESSKENVEDGQSSPSVTVLEASPAHSSGVSTPHLELDSETAAKLVQHPSFLRESLDKEPIENKSLSTNGIVDKVGDLDTASINQENEKDGENRLLQEQEEGEVNENNGEEDGEPSEDNGKEGAANPAVISKPPQIVVPPQIVAAARQPELYASAPAVSLTQATPEQVSQPSQPSDASGQSEALGEPEGQGSSKASEDEDKQARKKKKDKKLTTGSSLMMKKKHMSSMVQKWQKVKKEVEKEDRAKEMRQAAIRKKIEELK